MTVEERAEKIAIAFSGMTFSGGMGIEWIKTHLAAEIRALKLGGGK